MDPNRHSVRSGRRLTTCLLTVIFGAAIFLLAASAAEISDGQRLFDHETFGGNGRTCRTCHSGNDGTIDPQEVAERLAQEPSDPLFLHDGLDDFFGGTSRIAAHATILIERELPEGVVMLDDPSATSVVVARGVPRTVNTPALDAALMYDMRDPDLLAKRRARSTRHAQAASPPMADQLAAIAEFQQTGQAVLFEQGPEVVRGRRCGAGIAAGAHRVRETRPRVLRRRAMEPAEQEGRVRAVPQRPDAEHGQRVRDDSNRCAAGMARVRHRRELAESHEQPRSHVRRDRPV